MITGRMASHNLSYSCGNYICDARYQMCEAESCRDCEGSCTEERIGNLPEKRDYCIRQCAIFMYQQLNSKARYDCMPQNISLGALAVLILVILAVFLMTKRMRTHAVSTDRQSRTTESNNSSEMQHILPHSSDQDSQMQDDASSVEDKTKSINGPYQAVQNGNESCLLKMGNPSIPVDPTSKMVTNACSELVS